MIMEDSNGVYKTYNDGYIVRKMKPSEMDLMLGWWSKIAAPPKDDPHIAMEIFPNEGTFFIGEYSGKPVVSFIQLPWGNNVYYGTFYYCKPEYRRHHFGSRLKDDVAADLLKDSVLIVDARKGYVSESNVNKFGYCQSVSTGVYTGVAKVVKSQFNGQITEVGKHDFSKIMEFDSRHFFSGDYPARRLYLERLFNLSSGRCLVATDKSNAIVGLSCRRPSVRQGHHVIGPIYALDKDIATALLSSLCSDITGSTIIVEVWDKNEEAVKLMKNFELQLSYDQIQQCFNGSVDVYKPTIFALTSTFICGF